MQDARRACAGRQATCATLTTRACEPNVFYEPDFVTAAAPVFGRDVLAAIGVAARRDDAAGRILPGADHAPPLWPANSGGGRLDPSLRPARHAAGRSRVSRGRRCGLARSPCHQPRAAEAPADAVPAGGRRRRRHSMRRSPTAAAAAPTSSRTSGRCCSPDGDRAEYLVHSIRPKKRKELRRQRHRLADIGAVKSIVATEQPALAAALERFLRGRGQRLERPRRHRGSRQRGVCALRRRPPSPRSPATARRACRDCRSAAARWPRPSRLRSGDNAWGWKIAYDEGFARASPGVQLLLDVTRDAARRREYRARRFLRHARPPDDQQDLARAACIGGPADRRRWRQPSGLRRGMRTRDARAAIAETSARGAAIPVRGR